MRKRSKPSNWTTLGKIFSSINAGLSGMMGWGYTATDPKRKILDKGLWTSNRATANELLNSSITELRSKCRDLVRNNPSAKAGCDAVAALLIGTGIALEPDTGDEVVDAKIREQWNRWIKSCDIDGRDLYALQLEAAHELPQAGESIWRMVVDPSLATKDNPIPVRILALEGEWLPDAIPDGAGESFVAGISTDAYGRAVAYWLANPVSGRGEVVAARHVIHNFERTRAMQLRGEPMLASVIETLMNERDLVDAELYAAKQTAAMALVITSESHDALDTSEDGDSTDPAQAIRLGGVARLLPNEDIKAFGHTRPSQQIAPFRQMLRGDIAAALRIPQRFLDRDVGRANYSSMRADMLDTNRLLDPLREQIGQRLAGDVYRYVLPYLAIAAGVKLPRSDYRLIPDGHPYIDPSKDIAAAKDAIDGNLSTYEYEIGKRGGDYRQVWAQLAKEKEQAKALGLTMAAPAAPAAPAPVVEAEDDAKDEAEDKAEEKDAEEVDKIDRMRLDALERSIRQPVSAPSVTVEQRISMDADTAQRMGEAIGRSIPQQVVNVPPLTAPTIQIMPAEVRLMQEAQAAPNVVINIPEQAAPTVNVAPPKVEIANQVIVPARTVKATPQKDGSVLMEPQE